MFAEASATLSKTLLSVVFCVFILFVCVLFVFERSDRSTWLRGLTNFAARLFCGLRGGARFQSYGSGPEAQPSIELRSLGFWRHRAAATIRARRPSCGFGLAVAGALVLAVCSGGFMEPATTSCAETPQPAHIPAAIDAMPPIRGPTGARMHHGLGSPFANVERALLFRKDR